MAHTHDGIDWTARIALLRRADELEADINRRTAERIVDLLGERSASPVVVDVGSGAGGMSAALAATLAERGGGRLVLADAVDELLAAAAAAAAKAVPDGTVRVDSLRVDAADEDLPARLPAADLVWASRVVHHLPDQQKAVNRLADVLAPGGWLVLAEGGLATRYLPWDLGVGEPGLGARLTAANDAWFVRMRGDMPGSVRLPVGWTSALAAAGLTDVGSFSYLIDLPAPPSEAVRLSVVDWLTWMAEIEEGIDESDRDALRRLLDPDDEAYVGARNDIFILGASTVHLGRRAS